MSQLRLSDADAEKAQAIWAEYQQLNDVSGSIGQAVGIEPVSGRIWFGEDASDVVRQARSEGITATLICQRVGFDYYVRKGGTR